MTLTFRRFRLWAGPWHGFFGRLGPFRGLAFLPVVLGVLVSILLGWRDVLLLDLLGLLDDLGLLGLGVHDLPLLGLLGVLGRPVRGFCLRTGGMALRGGVLLGLLGSLSLLGLLKSSVVCVHVCPRLTSGPCCL